MSILKQVTLKFVMLLLALMLISLALSTALVTPANAKACDFTISKKVKLVDGRKNYAKLRPGHTVCIQSGTRDTLTLNNIEGKPGKPITFINSGGRVIIKTTRSMGLLVNNSRYFRITGTGSNDKYGIHIQGSRTAALNLRSKTEQYEIDHIEISQAKKIGISSKTQESCPDGSTNTYDYDGDGKKKSDKDDVVTRNNFVQRNVVIHDTYIHHIGTEAFYIGSSFYHRGKQHTCKNGGKQLLFPPALDGVHIYNNIVEFTGWNGIQVGSVTKNCYIHHNVVRNDSTDAHPVQNSSIQVNPGSQCDIYSNFIKDGKGVGIGAQGDGHNRIFNNVIINVGHGFKKGEKVGSGIVVFKANYHIAYNTIVNPRNIGIRFGSNATGDNRIENNIIVAPGNGQQAYIATKNSKHVKLANNLMLAKISQAKFVNPGRDDYSIKSDSPAVDAGKNIDGIKVDFRGVQRPYGRRVDIGAYEYAKDVAGGGVIDPVSPPVSDPITDPVMVTVPDPSLTIPADHRRIYLPMLTSTK